MSGLGVIIDQHLYQPPTDVLGSLCAFWTGYNSSIQFNNMKNVLNYTDESFFVFFAKAELNLSVTHAQTF